MEGAAKKSFDEITRGSVYYNTRREGRPRLLVMSGLPMSGKSYLSNMISEKMDGKVCIVRSDKFRPVVAKHMGRSQPLYDSKEHALVFEVGKHLVEKALDNGWPTIADATNLKDEYRNWAVEPARDRADVLIAFLEISPELAMDRAREKDRDGSAATPAVYVLLNYEKEPLDKCTSPYVTINSEIDIKPWADVFAKWLRGDLETVKGTTVPVKLIKPTTRVR